MCPKYTTVCHFWGACHSFTTLNLGRSAAHKTLISVIYRNYNINLIYFLCLYLILLTIPKNYVDIYTICFRIHFSKCYNYHTLTYMFDKQSQLTVCSERFILTRVLQAILATAATRLVLPTPGEPSKRIGRDS